MKTKILADFHICISVPLITDLHKESENATDWFRLNEMVLDPNKF